jgi:hypothetical protein
LHDLLKPSSLVVCDPRKAALLKEGNKSDRIASPLAKLSKSALHDSFLRSRFHADGISRGSRFRLSGALIESFLAACLLAALMPVSEGKIRGLLLAVMIALWLARPLTA